MMPMQKTEKSLSAVAALLLFAVFAAGVLGVLLGGAQSYRKLNARDEAAYQSRTCAQYIMTKLRQAESPTAVEMTAFGDGDALQIVQTLGTEKFLTRIYCHEGYLMELYVPAGLSFAPEDGTQILPASGLSLTVEEGLLHISVQDGSGRALSLRYALQKEGSA